MTAQEMLRKRSEIQADCMECPVYAIEDAVQANGGYINRWGEILTAKAAAGGRDLLYRVTEGVWFTREEAQKFLDATNYNFTEHARVYAYGARGRLRTLLKALTVEDFDRGALIKGEPQPTPGEKILHAPAGELGDEQIRREIETFIGDSL